MIKENALENINCRLTAILSWSLGVNTLRPRQNGRCFADDTFKCIFLNENVRISIKISLKFVPKGPINNNPALVQIMAWCRSDDKPLSEPWWLVYWRIYASLGLNELKMQIANFSIKYHMCMTSISAVYLIQIKLSLITDKPFILGVAEIYKTEHSRSGYDKNTAIFSTNKLSSYIIWQGPYEDIRAKRHE